MSLDLQKRIPHKEKNGFGGWPERGGQLPEECRTRLWKAQKMPEACLRGCRKAQKKMPEVYRIDARRAPEGPREYDGRFLE